jgi:hypothetical protein
VRGADDEELVDVTRQPDRMEVDIFEETDDDLIVGVELFPLLEDLPITRLGYDLGVVKPFEELTFGGPFQRLAFHGVPCNE